VYLIDPIDLVAIVGSVVGAEDAGLAIDYKTGATMPANVP
jgi:hypothetical protein